jgi:DNA polymerase-3 subunit epsilon
VSGELSLFGGDESPEEPDQPVSAEAGIADWLVDDIRTALTTRGLTTMTERQKAIESIVDRPVESLRSLTRAEALRVLASLRSQPMAQAGGGSAWDARDEDTWIDRL